jgi:hypothetical protein
LHPYHILKSTPLLEAHIKSSTDTPSACKKIAQLLAMGEIAAELLTTFVMT